MRIIAGIYKSRKIESVPGLDVRPTPDRLRESLFSILSLDLEGSVFVDAYAGSGSVGLEAISRGARKVVFLERDKQAIGVMKDNLAALGVGRGTYEIVSGGAAKHLADWPADIVFLDPPYDKEKEYLDSLENAQGAIVIAQHSVRLKLPAATSRLERYREVRQGDNVLSFYRQLPPPVVEVTSPADTE